MRARPRTLLSLSVIALALPSLMLACGSNHHVSPFPPLDPSTLFNPAGDLPAQLARAEREAASLGLHETLRIEGKLRGGAPFVALGFEGADSLGRLTRAARVVTPSAVVLALGPPHLAGERADEPRELLRSLGPEGVFPSGIDLNGDSEPDVALRAEDGSLALYRIEARSATRYPVALSTQAMQAADENEDGRPDLTGIIAIPPDDPIAPELRDVAIAVPQGFTNEHPDARAFHAKRARAPLPPKTATPELRLRRALERAYHAAMAGEPASKAFQPAADLAAELAPLPEHVASSWVRWRGYLADTLVTEAQPERQ